MEELWDEKITIARDVRYFSKTEDAVIVDSGVSVSRYVKQNDTETYLPSDSMAVPEELRSSNHKIFVPDNVLEHFGFMSLDYFVHAYRLYKHGGLDRFNLNEYYMRKIALTTQKMNKHTSCLFGSNGKRVYLPFIDIVQTYRLGNETPKNIRATIGLNEIYYSHDNIIHEPLLRETKVIPYLKPSVTGIIKTMYKEYFRSSVDISIKSHLVSLMRDYIQDISVLDKYNAEYNVIYFDFVNGFVLMENKDTKVETITNIWEEPLLTKEIREILSVFDRR